MAVSLSDYLARTNPGGAGDLSTNSGAFLDSVNYGDTVAYTPKAHYAPYLSEQWMPSWDGGGGNVWMFDDTGYPGRTDALKAEIQAAGDRTWDDYNAAVDALSMHENGYTGSRSAWDNPQFAREFGAALGYTPNEFNAYSASLNDSNANPFVRQRVLIDSLINEHGLGGNAQVMDWRNRVEPALTRGGDAWVERNNDKVTWGEVLSAIGFVGGALGGFASLAGGPGLFASLGSGVGEAAGAAQGG